MRLSAAPIGALLLLSILPLQARQPPRPRASQRPRLIVPAPRLGVPVPRLGVPVPRLGVPVPRLGVPVPRLPGRLRAVAPSQSDPAAQDLLRRMLKAENSLALSGNQVTTVSQNGLDLSSEQQVQRDGARLLRIDYLRPARLAGEQIIDNGRFYCHFLPAKDTLELSPSKIQSLRVRVPEVIAQIRKDRLIVQSAGQDVVAGHACDIIQVAARNSAPAPWRRFWVDPTNGAQLRIEQYGADGRLQSVSYYTQVAYSPRLDPSVFRVPTAGSKVVTRDFAPPSLTLDQVRAQAVSPVPVPTYLPEGFTYQAGSVSQLPRGHVVELRYFNGANTLSVFETLDGPVTGSTRTQHPRHGVLFGRQAGMKVVIIGNEGNGELEKVLNSLR